MEEYRFVGPVGQGRMLDEVEVLAVKAVRAFREHDAQASDNAIQGMYALGESPINIQMWLGWAENFDSKIERVEQ